MFKTGTKLSFQAHDLWIYDSQTCVFAYCYNVDTQPVALYIINIYCNACRTTVVCMKPRIARIPARQIPVRHQASSILKSFSVAFSVFSVSWSPLSNLHGWEAVRSILPFRIPRTSNVQKCVVDTSWALFQCICSAASNVVLRHFTIRDPSVLPQLWTAWPWSWAALWPTLCSPGQDLPQRWFPSPSIKLGKTEKTNH